jgi:hypothetical protein
LVTSLYLLCVSPSLAQTTNEEPITKDGLFRTLATKVTDLDYLIERIKVRRVSFRLDEKDEEAIRRLQPHLNEKQLQALISTINHAYQEPPPPQVVKIHPGVSVAEGTDLVGIGGTGVTARVFLVRTIGSQNETRLRVVNTSGSGVITNIGFMVNGAIPTTGKVIPDPDSSPPQVIGPGRYAFVPKEVTIETRDYRIVTSFAFMTIEGSRISKSFKNGVVENGSPAGYGTWFSLNDLLGEGDTAMVICFQGIGKGKLTDIAVYSRFEQLLLPADRPASSPRYGIFRKQ